MKIQILIIIILLPSINIILITYIFKNYFSESDTNNLLKISILILLLVFCVFFF